MGQDMPESQAIMTLCHKPLGFNPPPVLDHAGQQRPSLLATVGGRLQLTEDATVEGDLARVAGLDPSVHRLYRNQLVVEDPKAVQRQERQLGVGRKDGDLHGLQVGQRTDEVELGAHHRWRTYLGAESRLTDDELEPPGGIVDKLPAAEAYPHGLLSIVGDAIERHDIVEEFS